MSFTCLCPPEATGSLCEKLLKPPYDMPAFSGSSYIEIKKIKAYNKVQVNKISKVIFLLKILIKKLNLCYLKKKLKYLRGNKKIENKFFVSDR